MILQVNKIYSTSRGSWQTILLLLLKVESFSFILSSQQSFGAWCRIIVLDIGILTKFDNFTVWWLGSLSLLNTYLTVTLTLGRVLSHKNILPSGKYYHFFPEYRNSERIIFGSVRSSRNSNVRPSGPSLSRALILHLLASDSSGWLQLSLSSVSGQSQVSLRSV